MRMTLWPSSSVALKFEMYPSSFRMRAISTFSRDAGISTFWCRACSALRTLVSISATGSVNLIFCFSSRHPFAPRSAENLRQLAYHLLMPFILSACHLSECHPERDAFCLAKDLPLHEPARKLPGRLRDPRNFPAQRQPAEAQAAQAELAQVSPRPPADLAPVVTARGKLWRLFFFLARQLKLLFDLRVFYSFRCSHAILKNFLLSNRETP